MKPYFDFLLASRSIFGYWKLAGEVIDGDHVTMEFYNGQKCKLVNEHLNFGHMAKGMLQ